MTRALAAIFRTAARALGRKPMAGRTAAGVPPGAAVQALVDRVLERVDMLRASLIGSRHRTRARRPSWAERALCGLDPGRALLASAHDGQRARDRDRRHGVRICGAMINRRAAFWAALSGAAIGVLGYLLAQPDSPAGAYARAAHAGYVRSRVLTPADAEDDVIDHDANEAGYRWAERQGLDDVADCPDGPPAYREGCLDWVREAEGR
jgi:hypothetical protein